jgi:glycosyltransferase involved in cell wall biosynthesis
VTAIYLPSWFHYRAMTWNPALGRYLRARLQNFDVVHIFGLYDFLGARVARECRQRKIPYVVEPIGMFVPIVRSVFLKRLYHRYYGRELLSGASRIIATSEQERAELQAGGIPGEKIILRRNGVEFPAAMPPRGEFRDSLQIPADAKVLLFLGRLSSKKSPDLLLKAFADVCNRQTALRESLHLVFAGPDEAGMSAKLGDSATQLGLQTRVHVGPALSGDAKWSAYRDADIFVLPSQNENFGNTAAEAVAAGTPVILTDQCGIAPLLGGKAAIVVKHDRTQLASAIETLLLDESLYRELKAGCAKAVTILSWQQPIEEMEVLYRSIAGASPS